ncbi:MAG: hypothetical protein ACR2QX_05910 [Woeseiaceae bacterium]
MKKLTIAGPLGLAFLSGCSATAPQKITAPPFECTSIHPEVCAIEEQFHVLRFEQAAQNKAIDEAERRRRAATSVARTNRG